MNSNSNINKRKVLIFFFIFVFLASGSFLLNSWNYNSTCIDSTSKNDIVYDHRTDDQRNINPSGGMNFAEFGWNVTWSQTWGDRCNDLVVDSNDNIYACGTLAINDRIGLVKINANGAEVWNCTWGYSPYFLDHEYGTALTIDYEDNLYLTGTTKSLAVSGNHDVFLAKCNSSGDTVWQTVWGFSGYDIGYGISVDSEGNLYITGKVKISGTYPTFLTKYNNTGHYQWNITWGSGGSSTVSDVSVDSQNNIYVTGFDQKSFLRKYNSTGHLQWYYNVSSPIVGETPIFKSMDIDRNDDVYLCGYINVDDDDAILFKFNSSGSQLWYKCWGDNNNQKAYAVKTDSYNSVFLTGRTYNVDRDIFLVKFSQDGDYMWEIIWNQYPDEEAYGLAFDSMGNAYIGGYVDVLIPANEGWDKFLIAKLENIRINLEVLSPIPYQIASIKPLEFHILLDNYVNRTWYTLDGGLANYTFTGATGTVNKFAWNACEEGEIIITFYVNYSSGEFYSKNVTIIKDLTYCQERNIYALLIGINNYRYISDLSYCINDVNSMKSLLTSNYNCKDDNIIVLKDSAATRNNIIGEIGDIADVIDPDDLFFFYFSGHGGQLSEPPFYRFICPSQAEIDDPYSLLFDTHFADYIAEINCTEKYVVMDSCRSGGFIGDCSDDGNFIMTSCGASEDCLEDPDNQHGVFTNYFLQSLDHTSDTNGDKVKSLEECFSYISQNTESRSNSLGYTHHPQKDDNIPGPSVLYPAFGEMTFSTLNNQLNYTFKLFGQGRITSLKLYACSVAGIPTLEIYELLKTRDTDAGFELYNGTIDIDSDISGYSIQAGVNGNSYISLKYSGGLDTDGDKLLDIDEMVVYMTDPVDSDTDDDGYDDGEEVEEGWDPLDPDDPGQKEDKEENAIFLTGMQIILACVFIGAVSIASFIIIKKIRHSFSKTAKIAVKSRELTNNSDPKIQNKFCKRCGYPSIAQNKFCINCGNNL